MKRYLEIDIPLDTLAPNKAMSSIAQIAHSLHGNRSFAIDLPDIEKRQGLILLRPQCQEMAMPEHAFHLGRRLRVFGDVEFLEEAAARLQAAIGSVLPDASFISPIARPPISHQWRRLVGIREHHGAPEAKSARLYAHLMKKHGCLPEGRPIEVLAFDRRHSGPYLSLLSASTTRMFRRFIDIVESADAGVGGFSSHGLSTGSAVPTF